MLSRHRGINSQNKIKKGKLQILIYLGDFQVETIAGESYYNILQMSCV